jgi:hypothetical protein
MEKKESLIFTENDLITMSEEDCSDMFKGNLNLSKILENLKKLRTELKAPQAVCPSFTETSPPPLAKSQPLPLPLDEEIYHQLVTLGLNDVINWLKSTPDVKQSDLFELTLKDCEDFFEEHGKCRANEIYEQLKTIKVARPTSQSTVLPKAPAASLAQPVRVASAPATQWKSVLDPSFAAMMKHHQMDAFLNFLQQEGILNDAIYENVHNKCGV